MRAQKHAFDIAHMSSVYVNGLDLLAQRRYFQKLQMDDVFPDPYGIVESAWVDDVTKWPDL